MLKDKIKADSVEALKQGDKFKVGVLRFLLSLIDKKEMQLPPNSMKEEDVVGVLRKELKNKEDSIKMFKEASRADLYEPVEKEVEIVMAYMPKELSEDEVREIVKKVIAENDGADFALAMRESMKVVAGRAGGQIVSQIVRELLA